MIILFLKIAVATDQLSVFHICHSNFAYCSVATALDYLFGYFYHTAELKNHSPLL